MDSTNTLYIVGLRSVEDFKDYGVKCGDDTVIVLVYENCDLGKIKLPLRDLLKSYTKLRTVYWLCTGVNVFGCDSGKIVVFCNLPR